MDYVYRWMVFRNGGPLGVRAAGPTNWPPHVVEAMRERRENGDSLQAIGDDFGVTRERIRQVLQKHGYDKVRSHTFGRARIKSCAVCGKSYVAGEWRNHRIAEGHSTRSENPMWKLHDDTVLDMYARGERIHDISRACGGMTFFGIYRILRRYGVEPNRGGGKYVRGPDHRARVHALAAARKAGVKVKGVRSGWRAK